MRKLLTTAAVSAALVGGGIAAAATSILPAYAQSQTPTQSQPADGSQTQGRHPHARQALKEAIKTSADTIGISPQDLAKELKGGKSIADVAKEHNVDPQKVIDALVAKADARIDKAVQDGKLTQDKADKLKAKVPDMAAKLVNAHRHQPQAGNSALGN